MKFALFEPDIPQNVGSFIRLSACLGVELHVIEPCGFVWDERKLRQVALDYLDLSPVVRHRSFEAFEQWRAANGHRLVLLTTKTDLTYVNYAFHSNDILLLGRESSGVTEAVRQACDAKVTIPMREEARSLNVVLAAAMVMGEALRQTQWSIHGH